MKIRNGFVSNSSSSSFVLAVNKGENPKLTIQLEVDLSKYEEEWFMNLTQYENWLLNEYIFKTIDELLRCGSKYMINQYTQAKAAFESGKVLVMGSVGSDYDDPIALLLYENGIKRYVKDSKNFEVIGDED